MSSLTFTLIQANLQWENPVTNRIYFEGKIAQAGGKTQVVLLPELFSTGFSMKAPQLAESMNGPTVQWMKEVAAKYKIILTGSVIIEEDRRYYNRLIWMQPDGKYGKYDKRHLFAFGGEDQQYTAGNKRFIASVNGWKINVQICYDLRFPVWARQQFTDKGFEYDVLIYVANWPERRSTAWKTLLTARAIENQCYVIGVNRVGNDGHAIYHSGDSTVVDPLGEILYQKAHEEDVYTFALDKNHLETVRKKMPFWKEADPFILPTAPPQNFADE